MKNTNRHFSIFRGIGPLKGLNIPTEILAGITLAALAIPEVMGYTSIAGTPLVTGLYTLLVPIILFATFGGSKHLVVGADSATAAILAAGLAGMSALKSDEYVALSALLALMAAAFLVVARLVRLGFLADFLSRTVLIGFLSGVGIQVALGQITGMAGISGGHLGLSADSFHELANLSAANYYNILVAVAVIAIITGMKKISRKIPGPLIAVIGFIIIGRLFDLNSLEINMIGEVPGGLPHFTFPNVNWSWELLGNLTPTAISIFIVILTQSAATSRAFADKYNEAFDADTDLVGLSLANIGAGLTGTFVVNGSPTKTQMVDSAGGRSQLTHLVTASMVLLVLLFFTKPLANMPSAVLSAIVFLIGIDLIDLKGMKALFTQTRSEFRISLLTTLVVVFIGVKEGIVVAMIVSLLYHVKHGYQPVNLLIIQSRTHGWKTILIGKPVHFDPGLMIYRFTHSLYYANAHTLYREVKTLISQPQPPLNWFCIETEAIADIDFSAAQTLRSVYEMLKENGIQLVFSGVSKKVNKKLKNYGIMDLVGKENIFVTMKDLDDAYLAAYPQERSSNKKKEK